MCSLYEHFEINLVLARELFSDIKKDPFIKNKKNKSLQIWLINQFNLIYFFFIFKRHKQIFLIQNFLIQHNSK